MRASFYIVRHGSTAANNPKAELIRGWKPWPLSDKGVKEAREAGYALTGKGITDIWHSPIRRVKQTVSELQKVLKLDEHKIREHGSLVDWNTGAMEGMMVKAMIPFLDFYQRKSDLILPEGEPYKEYWDRWKKCFRDCVDYAIKHPDDKLVLVSHARNLVTLDHWLKRRPIGPVSYDGVPGPGSITEVSIDGRDIKTKVIHGERKWK